MQLEPNTRLFRVSGLFVFAVITLFALRQDFWLRDTTALFAGLPAGLAYHLGYCLLVALVLGYFVFGRRR